MKTLIYSVLISALFILPYLSFDLYSVVQENKQQNQDYAEINRVNYELFNIELWKEQALGIFQKKIREFRISDQAYDSLGEQIQVYLAKLYKQYFESGELIDMIIGNLENGGNINPFFLDAIKTNVTDQLDNLNLKSQIPGFSNQMLDEIRQNEPMLIAYLQQEILRLLADDVSSRYFDRRRIIFDKYGFSELESTELYLKENIKQKRAVISKKIKWLASACVALLLIILFSRNVIGFNVLIGSMTLLSILLLVLGISMPMIDIDARLNSFSFQLLNEPINFEEQVIYYQSKSILEVTQTLWNAGGIDLKLVGLLVLLFSIVFPFFKLILSALYLYVGKIRHSAVARNIIFHLGKWSMADVFVVAIFMAYIGLYGLIASQLSSISQNQGGFAIETINYSKLSPGALFFTSYTLLSIFIGVLINKEAIKNQTGDSHILDKNM